jgi:hypothetical protein
MQDELFPLLETVTGALSPDMQLLASITAVIPLERMLSARRAGTGRPAKDRAVLSVAFVAKAVLNLSTTRDLMDRLRVDDTLRRLCGWSSARAVPHESKFSRAFAEFAETELPQKLHEAVIAATQKDRLIGHIARDSTAIPARERCDKVLEEKKEKTKKKQRKKSKGRKKHEFKRGTTAQRGTRIERQRHQKLDRMLKDLPRACDIGAKRTARETNNTGAATSSTST